MWLIFQKSIGRASRKSAPLSSRLFASAGSMTSSPCWTKTLRPSANPRGFTEFQTRPATRPAATITAIRTRRGTKGKLTRWRGHRQETGFEPLRRPPQLVEESADFTHDVAVIRQEDVVGARDSDHARPRHAFFEGPDLLFGQGVDRREIAPGRLPHGRIGALVDPAPREMRNRKDRERGNGDRRVPVRTRQDRAEQGRSRELPLLRRSSITCGRPGLAQLRLGRWIPIGLRLPLLQRAEAAQGGIRSSRTLRSFE